jgi:hypothetical protein
MYHRADRIAVQNVERKFDEKQSANFFKSKCKQTFGSFYDFITYLVVFQMTRRFIWANIWTNQCTFSRVFDNFFTHSISWCFYRRRSATRTRYDNTPNMQSNIHKCLWKLPKSLSFRTKYKSGNARTSFENLTWIKILNLGIVAQPFQIENWK